MKSSDLCDNHHDVIDKHVDDDVVGAKKAKLIIFFS